MESAFPITLSMASLHYFLGTGDALHLLVIPTETLWSSFWLCVFYVNGFKVADTYFIKYLFCPWPNLTLKTNHQIHPWFSISSSRPRCYSTMEVWVQFVRHFEGILCKSKNWLMGELLINSLLNTFLEWCRLQDKNLPDKVHKHFPCTSNKILWHFFFWG